MTTEDLIKNIKAAGFNVEEDKGYTYVNNVTTQEEYDKLESIVSEAIGDDFEYIEACRIHKREHPYYFFNIYHVGTGYTKFDFNMLPDKWTDYCYCGNPAYFIDLIEVFLNEDGDCYDEYEIGKFHEVIEWLKKQDPESEFVHGCCPDDKLWEWNKYQCVDYRFEDDGEIFFIGYIIPEVEEYDDED